MLSIRLHVVEKVWHVARYQIFVTNLIKNLIGVDVLNCVPLTVVKKSWPLGDDLPEATAVGVGDDLLELQGHLHSPS